MVGRGDKTPMVSVTNVDPDRMAELLEDFSTDVRTVLPPVLSIRNGRRSVVITGTPEQLGRFELYCSKITEREEAERKNKIRGGAVFSPDFHGIQVEVGFHTPRLAPAVDLIDSWAARTGLDPELTHEFAESVFVRPVDWVAEVERLHDSGAKWIIDLGPSDTATRLTAPIVRGLGVGLVPAATRVGQRNLFTVGAEPEVLPPWSSYAPTTVKLPDGSVKLSTKFTRLTGRSPILLAGMTPTTVDAKIVAAAANAGHWAELAGGGQVTEEIFEDRIAELTGLLEPGRAVQFNSLFLDPYLWKLQVGGKRLGAEGPSVRRADRRCRRVRGHSRPRGRRRAHRRTEQRRNQQRGVQARHRRPDQVGHQHRGRGARQGRHRAHRGRPCGRSPLVGGPRRSAAGHVCRSAQAAEHHRLRRRRHRYPRAGRRIPVRQLGQGYGFPAMPVDGILVGTAAMATLESTTSPAVKQMLVETTGTDHWISAGKANGRHGIQLAASSAPTSTRSTTPRRAAGGCSTRWPATRDAVADRRDELIAAMANTAKPYFGDIGDMTYLQWLQRYVELAIGDGDSTADTASPGSPWIAETWRERFAEMLKRAEARLHQQDSGPIETLFNDRGDAGHSRRGDRRAAGALSRRRDSQAAPG